LVSGQPGPGYRQFYKSHRGTIEAIAKLIFSVILNDVKDLKLLKIRDSSLYMKIAVGNQLKS